MAVNKVIKKDTTTLLDLSKDTVTPETLAIGKTALDSNGKLIKGEMPLNFDDVDTSQIDTYLDFLELTSASNGNLKLKGKGTAIYERFDSFPSIEGSEICCVKSCSFINGSSTFYLSFPKCELLKGYPFYAANSSVYLNFSNLKYIYDNINEYTGSASIYINNLNNVKYIGKNFYSNNSIHFSGKLNCNFIGSYAFSKGKGDIEFCKPFSVETCAFQNWEGNISGFADNVSYIGAGAFDTIRARNPSLFTSLPRCKYLGHRRNANDVISETVSINLRECKFIGNNAFIKFSSVDSIILNPSVRYIGYNAFYCTNILYGSHLSSIFNNKYLSYIGNNAFRSFNNVNNYIKDVHLKNIKYIGKSAFKDCSSLLSGANIILEKIKDIPSGVFYNCGISSIYAPRCLQIGEGAFYGCNISKADFPKCSAIYYGAFDNCPKLTNINLPELSYIPGYCSGFTLKELTLGIESDTNFLSGNTFSQAAIYQISRINFPKYSGSFGLSTFLPSTSFATLGFVSWGGIGQLFPYLEEVYIKNAASIHISAFSSCSYLKKVHAPRAQYITGDAFYNCQNLTEVNFMNAKNIYTGAFYSCKKLEKICAPNVVSIYENAFRYAFSNIENDIYFYFPKLKDCGQYAFANIIRGSYDFTFFVPNLLNLNSSAFYSFFGEDLKFIGNNSVKTSLSIGNNCFYRAMGDITFENFCITSLGQNAFATGKLNTELQLGGYINFKNCDLTKLKSIGINCFFGVDSSTRTVSFDNKDIYLSSCSYFGSYAFNNKGLNSNYKFYLNYYNSSATYDTQRIPTFGTYVFSYGAQIYIPMSLSTFYDAYGLNLLSLASLGYISIHYYT